MYFLENTSWVTLDLDGVIKIAIHIDNQSKTLTHSIFVKWDIYKLSKAIVIITYLKEKHGYARVTSKLVL